MASPRENLINTFKVLCGPEYSKMYILDIPKYLLCKKLKYYVYSLLKQLEFSNCICNNINLITDSNNNITIKNGNTLIKTYTLNDVIYIKNDNQLGMALFIEWGYLLNLFEKSAKEQLLIAL